MLWSKHLNASCRKTLKTIAAASSNRNIKPPRASFFARLSANGARQFRQSGERGNAAQPLFVVKGGRSADHGTRGDVAVRATLRGHDRAISDFAVPGYTHLPGQDHVLANLGGPGQAYLRAQHGILFHSAIMGDVGEVIDFSISA